MSLGTYFNLPNHQVTTYLVGELLLGLVEPEVLLLKRLVLILALLDDLPLASVYSSCRLLSPTSRSSGVAEDFSGCGGGCFLLLGLFLFLYLEASASRQSTIDGTNLKLSVPVRVRIYQTTAA